MQNASQSSHQHLILIFLLQKCCRNNTNEKCAHWCSDELLLWIKKLGKESFLYKCFLNSFAYSNQVVHLHCPFLLFSYISILNTILKQRWFYFALICSLMVICWLPVGSMMLCFFKSQKKESHFLLKTLSPWNSWQPANNEPTRCSSGTRCSLGSLVWS